MTKPEGIPSEVWTAAENALDLLLCNCRESSGSTEQLRADSIEPIARAILAERKVCFEIGADALHRAGIRQDVALAAVEDACRASARRTSSPHNPKDAQ